MVHVCTCRTSLNCPLPSTVDLPMHILNTEVLGFMVKPEDYESLDHAAQDFLNFKLENLGKPLPLRLRCHLLFVSIASSHLSVC